MHGSGLDRKHESIPSLLEATQMLTIDRRYPLSEVAEAHRYFGEGHVRGKEIINSDLLEITI